MNRLADNIVKLIGSSQVITSVYSVVKELIENSFDAGATSIEVKLVNYGHDVIEVRDNGSGISKSDVSVFAKRYYTSKIRSHQDLETLTSYGFRGEALASLCAVSEVTVTTKTASDAVSLVYALSGDGDVISTLPSHLGQGTTVCAKNLFKNLPVRKQFCNAVKQKKEDLKKVEKLLLVYAVIFPKMRLLLRHNKEVIWQKPPLENTAAVLQSFLGRAVMAHMEWHKKEVKELGMTIEACLPKPGSDVSSLSRSSPDRSFVIVNSRPVVLKEIDKLIRQYYSNCHACDPNCRPIYFVWITLPTRDVDVNLEPNKTTVMTTNMNHLKEQLEEMLLYVYGPLDSAPSWRYRDAGDKQGDALEPVAGTRASPALELPQAANREEGASKQECIGNGSSVRCNSDDNTKETEDCAAHQPLVFCDKDYNTVSKVQTVVEVSVNKIQTLGVSVGVNPKSAESGQQLRDGCSTASDLLHRTIPETGLPNTAADNVVTDISGPVSTVRDRSSEVKLANGGTADQTEVEHKNQIQSLQCRGDRMGSADSCFDTGQAQAIVSKTGDTDPRVNTLWARSGQQNGVRQESLREADDQLMPALAGRSGSQIGAPLGPESGNGMEGSELKGGLHWSRGTSVMSAQGPAQPVVLLASSSGHCFGKRPLSVSPDQQATVLKAPPEKQGRKLSPAQTTLYDIINNSAVKRPVSAKDLFIKDKRRLVVEQNPTADYETVTKILDSLWEGLTDEQRTEYKRKCWQDKKSHRKGLSNVRDMVAASSTQSSGKTAVRRKPPRFASVTDAQFSMKHLRCSVLSDGLSRQNTSTATTVIGHIPSCDVYVCTRGSDICLLNAHRLSEVVIYDRLLHKHQLQICHCQPVRLTPSNTNGYWWVLEQLARSQAPTNATTFTSLSDPRIVANGFSLKSWKDDDGKLCVELVGLCGDVPTYCYKDLVEVLELLAKDMSSSLARSRPLKVVHYLKGEAVRMVRGQAGERSKEDIQDLLNQAAVVVPLDRSACLHARPFFHTLLTDWDIAAASSSPKS